MTHSQTMQTTPKLSNITLSKQTSFNKTTTTNSKIITYISPKLNIERQNTQVQQQH